MAEIINHSPGPNVSGASRVLSITGALYVVIFFVFGGRLFTRWRNRQMWWDDYTIVAALIIAIAEWGLFLASTHYGTGRHNYYVSPLNQIRAQHLMVASEIHWAPSMMFIKLSIACMLLRIKQSQPWQYFLWAMIGIQIASCIASTVFQLVQCIPLAALWDGAKYSNAVCATRNSAFVSLYVNSAIGIATDVIFALVPITFIRKMQRPMRDKIVLSCLMGLGIFATAASIVKTTLVRNYGATGDALWDALDLTLWSIIEQQVGIFAACIPTLKSPVERLLHRFGILPSLMSKHRSNRSRSHRLPGSDGTEDSHHLAKMEAMRHGVGAGVSTGRQSEDTMWPSMEEDTAVPPMPNSGIVKTMDVHVSREDLGMEEIPSDANQSMVWKEEERTQAGWNAV